MSDVLFTHPIVNGSGVARGQTCSAELLGLAIYGDLRHGDLLPCLDRGVNRALVVCNDRTTVEVKQTRRWRLLVARAGTCHATGNDRVARRMALWAARSVEHLSDDPAVKACNDVLERWLAGDATDDELATAADAAYTAADDELATAADAAYTAADAAYTAADAAYTAAGNAAYAAADAAYAAGNGDEAVIDWFDQYLTAWTKVAADEGCLIPDDQEAEYVAFVESLDFLTESDETGTGESH